MFGYDGVSRGRSQDFPTGVSAGAVVGIRIETHEKYRKFLFSSDRFRLHFLGENISM